MQNTTYFVEKLKMHLDKFKRNEAGLYDAVQIVLALIMIVVVGAIGVFIADTTVTATGTPANGTIGTMLVNFLNAGKTGSSFIVILIIAAIGSVAIGYLLLFGRSSQQQP